MSNGFRRGHRGSVPRRKTSWELGPGSCVRTLVSGVGASFIGDAVQPTIDGLTQARLRGRLHAMLLTGTAAGDGFCGAFGIGLATAAAVAAGAASVPTPITEQAWDGWLYWMPIQLAVQGTTTFEAVSYQLIDVDTKAMRKLNEEDAIYAMVEIENEEGTATAEFLFDSRSLLMIP